MTIFLKRRPCTSSSLRLSPQTASAPQSSRAAPLTLVTSLYRVTSWTELFRLVFSIKLHVTNSGYVAELNKKGLAHFFKVGYFQRLLSEWKDGPGTQQSQRWLWVIEAKWSEGTWRGFTVNSRLHYRYSFIFSYFLIVSTFLTTNTTWQFSSDDFIYQINVRLFLISIIIKDAPRTSSWKSFFLAFFAFFQMTKLEETCWTEWVNRIFCNPACGHWSHWICPELRG